MRIWSRIKRLFKEEKKVRRVKNLRESDRFVRQAREQFLKLQKQGLSIPIATL